MTAPKNGKFFTAGEKPVLTIVIRDDKGNPIDHTKIDETTFATASFFVYGPRANAVPVLSNAAKNGDSKVRASASNSIPAVGTPTKGWTFADGDTFKISVNGGAVQVLNAPSGLQSPDQVRDWLKANLKVDVTVTSNATAGTVTIASNILGAPTSRIELYNSPVTTKMGWKPGPLPLVKDGVTIGMTAGTTMEPFVVMANVTVPANDLRPRSDPFNFTDPLVIRSADRVTYQLDDVKGLTPGTYMIYSYVIPNGVLAGTADKPGPAGAPNAAAKALNVSRTAIGFMTFQVGTETPEKKVATGCADCHGDTIWHLDEGPIHPQPFDADYCVACHDYQRWSGTGDLFSRVETPRVALRALAPNQLPLVRITFTLENTWNIPITVMPAIQLPLPRLSSRRMSGTASSAIPQTRMERGRQFRTAWLVRVAMTVTRHSRT